MKKISLNIALEVSLSLKLINFSNSNDVRTHNHLVRKRILNHLAKWLNVSLRTKRLWVRISLLSLKLRYGACFVQGVPWHEANYRVWIHPETCIWHDNNIQLINFTFISKRFVLYIVSLVSITSKKALFI